MFRKIHRGNTQKRMDAEKENYCQHEGELTNWKCSLCEANISKFEMVFDDNHGRVSTFAKIIYENSFLDDFKAEFKEQSDLMKMHGGGTQPLLLY